MKPTDFQKLSIQYLYGEISDKDRSAFEKHLKSCEGCRKELEEMRQTVNLLDKIPEEEPSPTIKSAILQYAAIQKTRKREFWEIMVDAIFAKKKAFRLVAAVFAIFIAFAMLIFYFRPPPGGNVARSSPSPEKVAVTQKTPIKIGVSGTPSPGDKESTENIAALSDSQLGKKISQLETQIKSVENPDVGFDDSMEFYQGETNIDDNRYEPFVSSRPYRRITKLQAEAESLRKKMMSL